MKDYSNWVIVVGIVLFFAILILYFFTNIKSLRRKNENDVHIIIDDPHSGEIGDEYRNNIDKFYDDVLRNKIKKPEVEEPLSEHIKNVKIIYNIGGKHGQEISKVQYRRKNGTFGNLKNKQVESGEVFVIHEEIKRGSIKMSGKFKIISYEIV